MVEFLCAKIGGIWCYWPSDLLVRKFVIAVLVVLVFWIIIRKNRKRTSKKKFMNRIPQARS